MAPKIFCTGVTGYIGGDALYAIKKAHPDWQVTALVRNSDKGELVATDYPDVKLVYGDLDAVDLIAEQAQNADVVYHFANCDHEASANAISKGLSQRSSRSYWIHTSGTGILTWETVDKECYGEELPRVFDDMDGVGELTNQPDRALHRAVDKIVLAASAGNPHVQTAIVCPPTIYGPGRGPDNQRSQQAYIGARCILKQGEGFMPGKGRNIWHEVHVQDLSNLYLLLGEAAVSGGGKATWNEQGYYLAENGAFAWGDIFKAMTKIAHGMGLLPSDECRGIEASDLWNILPYGPLIWGTNSRGVSQRGKTLLGWEPVQKGLMEELPDIVRGEAAVLLEQRGLKPLPFEVVR